MDLRFTAEEEAFRREIQDFVKKELPPKYERVVMHGGETEEEWDFVKKFTRKLGEKGWIAIWWPKEYGGLEGTDIQYLIFNEEMAYYRAPRMDGGGSGIVGPTKPRSPAIRSLSASSLLISITLSRFFI